MATVHNFRSSRQPNPEWFLSHFSGVRHTYGERWMVRCPAHDDRDPSLSISFKDDRFLIHCFAGCSPEDVVKAVGLSMADLFLTTPNARRNKKSFQTQPISFGDQIRKLECVLHELERRAGGMHERAVDFLAITHGADISTWSPKDHARVLDMALDAISDMQKVERIELLVHRYRQWKRGEGLFKTNDGPEAA